MGCSAEDLAQAQAIFGGDLAAATTFCDTYDVSTIGLMNAFMAWSVRQMKIKEANTPGLRVSSLGELAYGLDTFYMLFGAFSVFLMQLGFAMFVAGVVSTKNMSSVLLKSVVDTGISAVGYYLLGYAFTVGVGAHPNGFIGDNNFALTNMDFEGANRESVWQWNWAFCAASTTLMAGAVAGRCTFLSYVLYAFFYSIWVYPVVAHWQYSPNGWLSPFNPNAILGMGTIDFSGSGVVHMLGGFAGLAGCIILGPRTGRYQPDDGSGRNKQYQRTGVNPALYILGTFMLWFGWYAFNVCSTLSISTAEAANTARRIATNTTLSASAAGIVSIIIVYLRTKSWTMLSICTGTLGGLVAMCAGGAVVQPWAALICGAVASPVVVYGDVLMDWLKVDDPACSMPLHGMSGAWGMLFVGLLADESLVSAVYNKPMGQGYMGIFYGGHGQILLNQFIAVCVIAAWSSFWILLLFWGMNSLRILRVDLEAEAVGLDSAFMGDSNPDATNNLRESKVGGAMRTTTVVMRKSENLQQQLLSRNITSPALISAEPSPAGIAPKLLAKGNGTNGNGALNGSGDSWQDYSARLHRTTPLVMMSMQPVQQQQAATATAAAAAAAADGSAVVRDTTGLSNARYYHSTISGKQTLKTVELHNAVLAPYSNPNPESPRLTTESSIQLQEQMSRPNSTPPALPFAS